MEYLILEHPRLPSRDRFNDIANTPLWSCLMGGYAASALEQAGFTTALLDHAQPGLTFDQTLEAVLALNPGLVSVNAVYFWEESQALVDFFTQLKAQGWQGHLNLFGFFPTLVFDRILAGCPAVDSICVGEFEHTLPALARALDGSQGDIHAIPGLATAENLDRNTFTRRPPEKNPDIFAPPRRGSLEGRVTLLGSRGCYNHCSFCPVPSFYNQGSLWRGRSPENILREVKALHRQGVRKFYFSDANFIGPGRSGKKRTLALMELLRPLNIDFGMETRPQDLDAEVLEAMVSAGFSSLLMGIESGSKAVLEKISKGTVTDTGARAIALCREFGIEPEIGFLMFVPDASPEDLAANMAFLKENRLLDRLERTANLLSHQHIVLAGTSGYDQFQAQGRLQPKGIFGFEGHVPFTHPTTDQVREIVVHAAHTVLRSMGEPDSPIHWAKTESLVHQAVNDYLVTLFDRTLENAKTADLLGEIAALKEKINTEIQAILGS